MSRFISFIALLAVIVLLIVLFYKVMVGFFIPLFLAALLVVVFRPLHVWVICRCKGRLKLSAMLTTAAILLSVLVPLAILFVLAAFESQQMLNSLDRSTLIRNINDTRAKLNLTLPEIASDFGSVEDRLANIAEMDRLEDVIYLREELSQTSLYNDDLANQIGDAPNVREAWEGYVEKFEELKKIQSQIANPTALIESRPDRENDFAPNGDTENGGDLVVEDSDDSGDELEIVEPAVLIHDFQEKLSEANDEFARFKVEALGGSPFWVWLREMANPDQATLEEYGGGIVTSVRKLLVGLGATTTSFLGRTLLGGAIMIIGLYFFLLDGPKMLDSLKNLSPIQDNYEQELIDEFGKVSRAVVVATLLAALVQALLGGIGYYFAGLESIFLLTLLTGCLALVPFVGAAAVWVPCALWLYFIDNNTTAAIGLAIYGLTVISMSDNLIKPLVLHGQSNIHPLVALLSVLGGVTVLGPIGILIGPMIVAFLQTLLKILQRELVALDGRARVSTESPPTPPPPTQAPPTQPPPAQASSTPTSG